MSRRILAAFLPRLGAQRLRRLHRAPCDQPPTATGDPATRPLATWRVQGNRRLLDSVDAPALPPGLLHPGQALADAQALCPDLLLHPADPAAEAALLHRLALWCLRFTPVVAVEGADGLLLDTTGSAALFGGERALVARLRDALRRAGFTARVVAAATPGMAAALSRSVESDLAVPPGEEATALRGSPIGVLRLPGDTVAQLRRLGLRNLAELAAQPRAPLVRRFGAEVMAALDDATGQRARPLRSVRPPADFTAARDLPEPILTRAAIDLQADRLLHELCASLRQAGQGARRLRFAGFRVDGEVQELAVGTLLPSADPAHLARLLREPLGTLRPDLGFERLVLEATETNPLPPEQLHAATLGPAGAERQALAALVDRLRQRTRVWRAAPRPAHLPEHAVARAAPLSPETPLPSGWGLRQRPVRLLRRPRPLGVLAEVPDGPPLRLILGRNTYRVLRAAGPERLEPPWWEDGPPRARRDYFRLQTAGGPRLWVCRLGENRADAPARWFLHGYFA
ncbi:Y-family DNA polymerase [Roseomonas elaeocarpi]|uniref:DNA polymerase Y family protein n=1 Tax=Roseomonas elaeocarpi TaxID=907779 RepID=A0ABV6JM23_9PROT